MIIINSEVPSSNPRSTSQGKLKKNKGRRQRQKQRRRSSLASFPLAGGRYAGRAVCDVPISHLRWMLSSRKASDADLWVVHQYLDSLPGIDTRNAEQKRRCGNG